MGIKLKFYTRLLLVSTILSCGIQKTQNEPKYSKEYYILAYKKEVLYDCINEKTNGEFYNLLNKYNDLGLYSEVSVLYHSVANEASLLGKEYAKKIEPVNYPDAEDKMPIFRDCVNYAFSHEIDSIARATYKKTR